METAVESAAPEVVQIKATAAIREEVPAESAEAPAREEVSFRGRKILLVEDNELNREIAVDLLEEQEMIVETAEDGRVAVETVRRRGPGYFDCILMDIQMPYMNGYEATKAIRGMFPEMPTPIIALSANAFEEDRRKSLEAGMNAHIAKPINIKELISTMVSFF